MHQYLTVINQYNISSRKKSSKITLNHTKNSLKLVRKLYNLGVLSSYRLSDTKNCVTISPAYFFGLPFYSSIKFVSRPNKRFSVSYKGLILLKSFSGSSLLLFNSDKGICTLDECLNGKIGGDLLVVFN